MSVLNLKLNTVVNLLTFEVFAHREAYGESYRRDRHKNEIPLSDHIYSLVS